MAFPEREPVSADAFPCWIGTQEERFELADGRVVRMIAGAKQSHNVASANILASLLPRTRRGGRRTTSGDTTVRAGPSGVRYPDVVADCGPKDPNALEASCPVLAVEVSSPGTSAMDATDTLDEHRAQGDVRLILLVEPDTVSLKLYRRDTQGSWQVETYEDLGLTIALPEIGAALALADVYDSLDPAPRTRLRLMEDDGPG